MLKGLKLKLPLQLLHLHLHSKERLLFRRGTVLCAAPPLTAAPPQLPILAARSRCAGRRGYARANARHHGCAAEEKGHHEHEQNHLHSDTLLAAALLAAPSALGPRRRARTCCIGCTGC